jgi:hypothetical protein
VTAPPRHPQARASADIPFLTRRYAACQVAITIVFAMAVLWFRQHYPLGLQVAAAAVVLWSTWSIGGLLDGRKRAHQHELVCLFGALAVAAALGASDGHLLLSVAMGALRSLSLAWTLLKPARLTISGPDLEEIC